MRNALTLLIEAMEFLTLSILLDAAPAAADHSSLYLTTIYGAFSAIILAIIGSWLTNHSKIQAEKRKLKEAHYAAYLEALVNSRNIDNWSSKERWDKMMGMLAIQRNRLFTIASVKVINKLLTYEREYTRPGSNAADQTKPLIDLIVAMRLDLDLPSNNFPVTDFVGAPIFPEKQG